MHGDFSRLNSKNFPQQKFMTKKDFVIVCGDFGIWRDTPQSRHWLNWLHEKPFTTLFVDGNHENFDLLGDYPIDFWNGGVIHRINDSVLHLTRGEIFILQGKTFFAMGGASSHDIQDGILERDDPLLKQKKRRMFAQQKRFRVNRESWWADELPNTLEYENAIRGLQRYNWEVDYVITHCAPAAVAKIVADETYPRDNLTLFFDAVAKKLDFKIWLFGHYHKNLSINKKFILLYHEIVEIAVDDMYNDLEDDIDISKLPDLDLNHIKKRLEEAEIAREKPQDEDFIDYGYSYE